MWKLQKNSRIAAKIKQGLEYEHEYQLHEVRWNDHLTNIQILSNHQNLSFPIFFASFPAVCWCTTDAILSTSQWAWLLLFLDNRGCTVHVCACRSTSHDYFHSPKSWQCDWWRTPSSSHILVMDHWSMGEGGRRKLHTHDACMYM